MSDKLKQDLDVEKLLEERNDLKKKNIQLTKALGDLIPDNQCLKDINEFYKKTDGESIVVLRSFIQTTKEKYKKVRVCRLWRIHPKSIYKKLKQEVMWN